MENKQLVTLGKYDPAKKYLCVYDGLNIKGTCKNDHCPGFMKNVWVPKGYGSFDFGKVRTGNVCPTCDRAMISSSFTNLGYMHSRVFIKGVRMNGDE